MNKRKNKKKIKTIKERSEYITKILNSHVIINSRANGKSTRLCYQILKLMYITRCKKYKPFKELKKRLNL